MIGIGPFIVQAAIAAAMAEQEYIKNLPEDEQKKYWQNREKELEHKRALEIANASRPRNFWGK